MNYYNDYTLTVQNSFSDLYASIIQFLPNILVALIVLLVGWVIGLFLANIFKRALISIGIDGIGEQLGLKRLSDRSGRNIRISSIVHWVIKWFFILASMIAAADLLGLTTITEFFYSSVLGYAGSVVIAMVIMLLGIIAANFLGDVISGLVKTGGFDSGNLLGSLTRWIIIIFAVIAALTELRIAGPFLLDLFRAVIAMLAIAGGLAFGLGGQDHARKVLDHVERGISRRD